MTADGPILIAYDGSPGAQSALAYAGSLLGPRDAVVVSVWEPLLLQAGTIALSGMVVDAETVARDDEAIESATRTLATDGAELARKAGFTAEARWQRGAGPIADAIIEVAEEIGASLIVTGNRGLGGLKSLLVGSVSDRLMHHASRPVLIVPRDEA